MHMGCISAAFLEFSSAVILVFAFTQGTEFKHHLVYSVGTSLWMLIAWRPFRPIEKPFDRACQRASMSVNYMFVLSWPSTFLQFLWDVEGEDGLAV